MYKIIAGILLSLLITGTCEAKTELWKITAYCSCSKCCGKSDGITASGHKLKANDKVVAINWLPFHTKVKIEGITYSVEDRGAESLFGTYFHKIKKTKHPKYIKHVDIWFNSHKVAKEYGVRYYPVKIVA